MSCLHARQYLLEGILCLLILFQHWELNSVHLRVLSFFSKISFLSWVCPPFLLRKGESLLSSQHFVLVQCSVGISTALEGRFIVSASQMKESWWLELVTEWMLDYVSPNPCPITRAIPWCFPSLYQVYLITWIRTLASEICIQFKIISHSFYVGWAL